MLDTDWMSGCDHVLSECNSEIVIIHIYYLPAGRSVLRKTVPEVLGRAQDRGHSFSQYGPTKAGK